MTYVNPFSRIFQTTVTVQSSAVDSGSLGIVTNQNVGRTAITGSFTGSYGRDFFITAIPATGYKFKEWKIETVPLEVSEIRLDGPFSSIQEVCGKPNEQIRVKQLYSDGEDIFASPNKSEKMSYGFYTELNGIYFRYTNTGVEGPFTCSGTPPISTETTDPVSPPNVGGGRLQPTGNNDTSETENNTDALTDRMV